MPYTDEEDRRQTAAGAIHADAVTFHLRVAWEFVGGDRVSIRLDVPVHAEGGECMQGFVGDCEFAVFTFEGFDGGETVTARFWVEDAAGSESNILIANYTVTGSCAPIRTSASGRRFEALPGR